MFTSRSETPFKEAINIPNLTRISNIEEHEDKINSLHKETPRKDPKMIYNCKFFHIIIYSMII